VFNGLYLYNQELMKAGGFACYTLGRR